MGLHDGTPLALGRPWTGLTYPSYLSVLLILWPSSSHYLDCSTFNVLLIAVRCSLASPPLSSHKKSQILSALLAISNSHNYVDLVLSVGTAITAHFELQKESTAEVFPQFFNCSLLHRIGSLFSASL